MDMRYNATTGLYTATEHTKVIAQSPDRWTALVASGLVAIEALDVLSFVHLVSVGMR